LQNFCQRSEREKPGGFPPTYLEGCPGANPTIVSYNASSENFYNATSSQVRLENKNIFFCFEKTSYPTKFKRLAAEMKGLCLSAED
jgi:hypothetical protein